MKFKSERVSQVSCKPEPKLQHLVNHNERACPKSTDDKLCYVGNKNLTPAQGNIAWQNAVLL